MNRTMELDARRVMLAREILSTDNEMLLSELEKTYQQVMVIINTKTEPEPDSKEYILNSIKEGYREMQEIKAGKRKANTLDNLIKELEKEAV